MAIVAPVFNDWPSAQQLIKHLADAATPQREFYFVLVDDASTEPRPEMGDLSQPGVHVETIFLPSNVGHQRAIVAGLSHVANSSEVEHIVVMDSDGEDPPEEIAKLLLKLEEFPDSAIVASRGKRFDSLRFKVFYAMHRVVFRAATGKTLDYGNFFALSTAQASRLIRMPEAQVHVGSALLKSRIPLQRLRVNRAPRYQGQSKMSFEGLVSHSLASLGNFSEQIFIRILVAAAGVTAITVPLVIAVVAWRLFYDEITPGWATSAIGFLILMTIQVWTFLGLGAMFTMSIKALLLSRSSPFPDGTVRDLSRKLDGSKEKKFRA